MISLHITSKNIHNIYIVTYEYFYTYRNFIN